MREVIKLYKRVGETPLECIGRFRQENPMYSGIKMTYLGRLDPMAEGLLLVLAGDMGQKSDFLEMDKTYEFEVLWGVSTDTYDVLGIPRAESNLGVVSEPPKRGLSASKLDSVLRKLRVKKTQSYPPYSSRTVGGPLHYGRGKKPLWEWSRENKIEEIDAPTRSIKVFNIEHVHTRWVSGEEILKDVLARIALVKGDFRQQEIVDSWNKELGRRKGEKFLVSKFTADVSSGTYIRGLAHEMGEMLETPALAYSIKRTRVGDYRV